MWLSSFSVLKLITIDAAVEWFYSDEFRLEDATKRYKDAVELAKDIEKVLDELKNEIVVLEEDFS